MNKTITSNIAGYVFHIDENAFDKLDAYLNTIRSYFKDSQGKDEIIADIEARLAEMLQERIGDVKQVVTLEDVNHVIQIMGRPEAFLEDDPDTAEWTEQKTPPRNETRRLFRDPDNRVAAGVCAGISHYIGLNDPIWLRLAFVISAFLSFGTAIIIYIILYLIIPEATTTADKLQMRGENVTVSNIEKRVNEELETVKDKWNDLSGENGAGRRAGNAVKRGGSLIGSIVVMFLNFAAKFIGFFLFMIGIIGFLSILTVPLGLPTMISIGNDGLVSSTIVQDIMHNMVGGTGMMALVTITIMLVAGVPLLVMTYVGSKLLFRYKGYNRSISLTLMGLWITGIVMSFAMTAAIGKDFTSLGTDTEKVELALTSEPGKTVVLALNHELGEEEPKLDVDIFDLELIISEKSTKLFRRPELDINQAKTGKPRLIIKRRARASEKQNALKRANNIDYEFTASDTSILFNGYFGIPDGELWRSQNVDLELLLPVGYTIYLSDDMRQIIYDIDNVTNTKDRHMLGRRWMMTQDGLACVDCKDITDEEPEAIEDLLEREFEKKQELLELEQERLEREMEKRQEELERIEEELEREEESSGAYEEASSSTEEILLRRVINASYKLSPTTFKKVTFSYPG